MDNNNPTLIAPETPAAAPVATTVVPPPPTSTPSSPPPALEALAKVPESSKELPTVDFSQFESARDITFPSTADKPTTPSTTDKPVTPNTNQPSQQQQLTQTTPQTPPTTQQPVAAQPPIASTGVDKDGKPLPVEIDLSQSAFEKNQPPAQQPPSAPQLHIVDGRDMTGFTEQEREAFKRMSNESFNLLAPAYREAKDNKTKLVTLQQEYDGFKTKAAQIPQADALIASNVNGYVLDSSYLQTIQAEQNIEQEKEFWGQQIEVLKSGGKPRILLHNGQQYVAGQELTPDARTERFLMDKLSEVNILKSQIGQRRQYIQQSWQQQVATDLATIKKTEDAYFPWFADGKQHSFAPIIDGFVAQMPPTQRNNPLARALGKAYAVIQHLQGQNAKLRSAAPTTPTIVPQSNQGPMGVASPAPVPSQGNKAEEDLMSAYNAIKAA